MSTPAHGTANLWHHPVRRRGAIARSEDVPVHSDGRSLPVGPSPTCSSWVGRPFAVELPKNHGCAVFRPAIKHAAGQAAVCRERHQPWQDTGNNLPLQPGLVAMCSSANHYRILRASFRSKTPVTAWCCPAAQGSPPVGARRLDQVQHCGQRRGAPADRGVPSWPGLRSSASDETPAAWDAGAVPWLG